MNDRVKRLVLPAVACLLALPAWAANPCEQVALAVEKALELPPGLLVAIGRVESGKYDAELGRVVPWPWTIDVQGDGRRYDTALEVIMTTKWLREKGIQNIDVGCFQVSLMYHPDAFPTMEDAFDPLTNGRYAGKLLASLKERLGTWPDAVAAYHSADPAKGIPYREKVYASLNGTAVPTAEANLEPIPPPQPAGPRQLSFGITLWTASAPGASPSVIHIGQGPAPPLPTVSSTPR